MAQNRVNKFVSSLRDRQSGEGEAKSVAPTPAAEPRAAAKPPSIPFFDPQVLTKLGHLDLISRSVVDGFLSGKHRSTHKGGCTDFAEFRPYAKGDDIRLLDWRHYAKSDRYYVKRYDDETNLQALLIVDTSGSMNFGLSTVSKWRYAQMAAASLAHLLLRQRDSVGLALVGQHLLDFVKPQPRRITWPACSISWAAPAGRPLEYCRCPHATDRPAQTPRHGRLYFRLFRRRARAQARAGTILLSWPRRDGGAGSCAEELTFPFRREAFFQDLELHRRMQVNPNTVRKAYLKEFQAFMDQLRTAMNDIGVDLMTFTTADDLGEVLAYHLRRRAAMKNPHRATVRA